MKHVIVIASGPSANRAMFYLEDAIRTAQLASKCQVIVVNNAWRLYPHADYLVAADRGWWDTYGQEVKNVAGEHITIDAQAAHKHNIRWMMCEDGAGLPVNGKVLRGRSNSGMLGISLAAGMLQAKHIYLIGFDNKPGDLGQDHFHRDHPAEIRKVMPYTYWLDEYRKIGLDAVARGIDVKHLCNSSSALEFFDRLGLGESLGAIEQL